MPRLRVKVEDRWYDVDVGPWEGDRVRVLVDEEPVMVFLEDLLHGQGCGDCGSRHQAGIDGRSRRQRGSFAPSRRDSLHRRGSRRSDLGGRKDLRP